jgi:hypothetical protein
MAALPTVIVVVAVVVVKDDFVKPTAAAWLLL